MSRRDCILLPEEIDLKAHLKKWRRVQGPQELDMLLLRRDEEIEGIICIDICIDIYK